MSENLAKYNVILELLTETKGTDQVKKEAAGLEKSFQTAKKSFAEIITKDIVNDATKGLQLLKDQLKDLGNTESLEPLIDRLQELTSKANLTETEFKELEVISEQLGKELANALPNAAGDFKELAANAEDTTTKFKTAKQELRELTNLITSGELEGEDLKTATARAAALTDEIGDVREQIKNLSSDTRGIDTLIEGTRAVAAGFAIAEGAIAVFGDENEDVQKALVKLNGIMAIQNGLQEAHALLLQNSNLKMRAAAIGQGIYNVVVGTSSGALKLFRIALAATGLGLFVILLGTLVANWDKVKKSISENAQAMFDFAKKVTTFIPPLNLLVKAGEYLYNNFDKVKTAIFGIDDAIGAFLSTTGTVLGKLTSGDFSGAIASFKSIGSETAKAFYEGQKEEQLRQRDLGLATVLENNSKLLQKDIQRREALGKDAFDLEKKNAINQINILRLRKASKEEISDAEFKLELLLLNRQKGAEARQKKQDERNEAARKKKYDSEIKAVEKTYALQEQEALKTIKDADELALKLKQIETQKQIDLTKIKIKYSKDKEKTQEEINKKLFEIENDKIDKEFALREKAAREAISDAKKLGEELEKLEVQKQIALAAKKQNIYTDDFVEIGNQIDELSRKYNSLSRVKVDPLDLLPRKTTEKILKNAKSIGEALRFLKFNIDTTTDGATKLKLQKELDNFVKQLAGGDIKDKIKELQDEFEITFNPKIKIDIKKKIKDLENELSIFQSPEFRKKLFISDGQIDITDLLPKDQVDAIEERLKIVKEKIKNIGKIDSITELNQFDKLKDEAAKLKEYLDKLGMNDGGFIQNLLGLSDEDFTKFQKDLENAFNIAKDSLNQILESEIEATDQRIELQQDRVSKAEKIAEKGNVKQLELEEERLTKLQEKREKFVAAQRILSQLEILQSNAVAAAKSIEAISTAFAAGGPAGIITGIATSIALAAQIGAIVSTVRNSFGDLPAFFEGTELISADHRFRGNKVTNGRDGYVFRGDGTERMVEGAINSKLNGFPNALLPDAVKLYQMQSTTVPKIIAIGGNTDKELAAKMDRMIESFENTRTSITLDKKGLAIQIDKMIQKNIQRKRFTA